MIQGIGLDNWFMKQNKTRNSMKISFYNNFLDERIKIFTPLQVLVST